MERRQACGFGRADLAFGGTAPDVSLILDLRWFLYEATLSKTTGQDDPPLEAETFDLGSYATEAAVTACTRIVIVNTPDNPTCAINRQAQLKELTSLPLRKSDKYGLPIFILSEKAH